MNHRIRCAIGISLLPVAVAVALTGCASRMTVEEAKRQAITTTRPQFTPPPRRINDVIASLEPSREPESSLVRQLKEEANATPPKEGDDRALSGFYQTRGEAARQLGLLSQALDDYREAYRLLESAGGKSVLLMIRLGDLEKTTGDFRQAIDLFEASLKIRESPSAYHQLVGCYLAIGDFKAASEMMRRGLQRCQEVLERTRNSRSADGQYAATWANINREGMEALFLEAEGKFSKAEKHRGEQMRWTLSLDPASPYSESHFRQQLAENLLNQGRLVEAELEARRALATALTVGGKSSAQFAPSANVLVKILMAQGRLLEAETLLRAAIKNLAQAGVFDDSNRAGSLRMTLGNVLVVQGDYTEAIQEFDRTKELLKVNRYVYENIFVRNNPFLAMAQIKTGRSGEAHETIGRGLEKARMYQGEQHPRTALWLGMRGMAHTADGRYREALADFSSAVPVLTERKLDTKTGFARRNLVRLVIEAYLDLLMEIHETTREKETGTDVAAEAFLAADYLTGGRKTQKALAVSGARAASTDPELSNLIRIEQDAQNEIATLEMILSDASAAPADQQDPDAMKDLKNRIARLSAAIATLEGEIRKGFPKYAEFVSPRAATWEQAQAALRPWETMLLYYPLEQRTFILALSAAGKPLVASTPVGREKLKRKVARLRAALEPDAKTLVDIPAFDVNLAQELYSLLLKPVEPAWKDAKDLLIVANDPLDQIPFGVLSTAPIPVPPGGAPLFAEYRKVPWLIRKVSIAMVSSVSSLRLLRTAAPPDPGRKPFAGFGDPLFDIGATEGRGSKEVPEGKEGKILVRGVRVSRKGELDSQKLDSVRLESLERLPDTAEEILGVARALGADPATAVHLGRDASEAMVKRMNLSDRKVVSFATHALVPGDLDGLEQPALALTPSAGKEEEDGLLTTGEILGLRLNADWVVLSACNTAAAEDTGAEALSGLVRAFFYAGTRSVLASLYPVETTSARKLVTRLFAVQKEEASFSRAQALRKAMLSLLEEATLVEESSGKEVSTYAHPFFWAPFILVGDPG